MARSPLMSLATGQMPGKTVFDKENNSGVVERVDEGRQATMVSNAKGWVWILWDGDEKPRPVMMDSPKAMSLKFEEGS